MGYVVKRVSDGHYRSSARWDPDLSKAKVWPTKNGASSHLRIYKGFDHATYQSIYEVIAELVEVHISIGPDPNAPPPPAKPPKKGKGKAVSKTSGDDVPDYWKDITGPTSDADIPA